MEEDSRYGAGSVLLELDGFEGPLDLLLDLARRQAVDLARISITTMVDQFVSAIAAMPRADLARVAEWLVMAAWLTWLKSRLLLPKELDEAKQGEAAGQLLIDRLAELEQVRSVATWLDARQQLGRDVFERGHGRLQAGPLVVADLAGLFQACLDVLTGSQDRRPDVYAPPRRTLWTTAQARARLLAALPGLPDGGDLLTFLPSPPKHVADRRTWICGAIASTFVAALELAREALIDAGQKEPFAAVTLRLIDAPPAPDDG